MAKGKSITHTLTAADEVRFWSYVKKTDGCWLWIGARGKSSDSYGRFHVGDEIGLTLRSHRLAYHLLVGQIRDGLEVIHSCDEPRCVNPSHLRLGTHADNMNDMKTRKRGGSRKRGVTHCQKGHPYSGQNLYVLSGRRYCRECKRADDARRRAFRRSSSHLQEST